MTQDKKIIKIDSVISALIPDFLTNRQADIENLSTALANKDYESIRITGHNLKGCGAGYGFQDITDIGANIEKSAVSQDDDDLNKQISDLKDYLESVEIVYE